MWVWGAIFVPFSEKVTCNNSLHPILGGVVGSKMPRFNLFGETVNLASQLESEGDLGRIQISYNTKTLLELTEFGGYNVMQRGTINIKGKGQGIAIACGIFWITAQDGLTSHS